jgi:hypothetical protein
MAYQNAAQSTCSLSLDELSLLPTATGMMKKNIFTQRKKAQAKAAKRAKEAVVIKSPRTQMLENQARMKQFADDRQKSVRDNQQAQQREMEERSRREALAREEQRKAMEQALESQKDAIDGENPDGAPKRKLPSKRSVPVGPAEPRPAPAPQAKPQIPRPVFVDAPTYASVSAMSASAIPPESLDKVKQMVASSVETAVLCAPYPDGRIRTWSELAMPTETGALRKDYETWTKPEAWASMAWDYADGNPKKLVSLSEVGNYNNILKISAGTPVTDPSLWPPQLAAMGIATDVPRSEVLPQSDYILRMTRTEPFSGSSSSTPVYRFMTMDQLVDEIALSLLAASQGIGPPVYGCVAWKSKHHEKESTSLYGMVMILRKSEGDMNLYIDKLRAAFPRTPEGPSKDMIRMAEETAINTIGLCFHIGWTGLINFDMKPSNMLLRESEGMFYLSDFDGILCRQVDPQDGGVKTCFFVNLLLMCFHVQAYTSGATFPSAFLATAAPILVELWGEAVRSPSTFGPGAAWLSRTMLAATEEEGLFDQGTLARLPPQRRFATQLKMMIYEYGFSTREGRTPSQKVKQFGWDVNADFFSGPAALVPQVLRYVVLYSSVVPEEYEDVFAARPSGPTPLPR